MEVGNANTNIMVGPIFSGCVAWNVGSLVSRFQTTLLVMYEAFSIGLKMYAGNAWSVGYRSSLGTHEPLNIGSDCVA